MKTDLELLNDELIDITYACGPAIVPSCISFLIRGLITRFGPGVTIIGTISALDDLSKAIEVCKASLQEKVEKNL